MNLTGDKVKVVVGRHTILVKPPKLRWWLKAGADLAEFYTVVAVLEKLGDKAGLNLYQSKLTGPSVKLLDRLAETTNKASRMPWRRPCAWYLENMTADELSGFFVSWLKAIGVEEIRKGFTVAGELAKEALGRKPVPKV